MDTNDIWAPTDYCENETANAIYNAARWLAEISVAIKEHVGATRELFYAFKYAKGEGLSVAEALTKLEESISASADDRVAQAIEEAGTFIADAIRPPKT